MSVRIHLNATQLLDVVANWVEFVHTYSADSEVGRSSFSSAEPESLQSIVGANASKVIIRRGLLEIQ